MSFLQHQILEPKLTSGFSSDHAHQELLLDLNDRFDNCTGPYCKNQLISWLRSHLLKTYQSQTCKDLSDLYSDNVWENRLSKKFGPDWENLSKQLVEGNTENLDLSDLYNQLVIQCRSKIKICEVCDNWSIVKGNSDQENAHWAGKMPKVTSYYSNYLMQMVI